MGNLQLADGHANLVRKVLRAGQAGVRQQQRKLFTAKSSDMVLRAVAPLPENCRYRPQTLIACVVAVQVVELLEQVHVRHDHGQRRLQPVSPLPLLGKFFIQGPSIRQSGQPIHGGQH